MRRAALGFAVLLLAACGGPPEVLREFPDIPAYPGAELRSREPADPDQPAQSCFYQVDGMRWVEVRNFYLKWMPRFGWETIGSPSGDERDPHILFVQGDIRAVVNPRSYADMNQFAVFRYKEGESVPAL